jgi:hypothetical protein
MASRRLRRAKLTDLTGAFRDKIFHGSPVVKRDAAAMNFVPSSTEPPPTESKKVIFCWFIISTAFINVS